MSFGLRDTLAGLVKAKYTNAKTSGALTFSSTSVAVVKVHNVGFQLRYCPALSQKPAKQDADHDGHQREKKRIDPFENPAEDLLVGRIPAQASHALVLNKFPIISNHFILATIANKQQTHALEGNDLDMTYKCLQAWRPTSDDDGRYDKLFAFFNSGDHSGASQAHRHLQLLPVEDMMHGLHDGSEWQLLVDHIERSEAFRSSASGTPIESPVPLPFVYYATRLPRDSSASNLLDIYNRLYDKAAAGVGHYISHGHGDLELHQADDGSLPVSYNLGMTINAMVICPRRREACEVKRDDGSSIGSVSVNGTILGGTLMVKDEELWRVLQNDPGKLRHVLQSIGIPPQHAVGNL